jgi:hypothetical protein
MMSRKRIVGFVAAALTLAMALPAWAGGRADQNQLRGMDIVVGHWWAGYDVDTFEPQSDLAARVLAHRRQVLNENGFRMSERAVATWAEMTPTVVRSILSGSPVASVFIMAPDMAMTLIRQNLAAPIPASVSFPAASPGDGRTVWNNVTTNMYTFGGVRYGFGVGESGANQQPTVLFFNKRLLREAGLDPDLPYNMQRDRTWTWDNFIPVLRTLTRDITGNGIIDTYGMLSQFTTDIMDAMLSSNNANWIGRRADGTFYNATTTPEFLEAMQFYIRIRDEGLMAPQPEGSNWDWLWPAFHEGRAAFFVTPVWEINEVMRNMVDDWGMVMFPMGPRRNNYAVYASEHVYVFPAGTSAADIERIVAALDLWHRPVDTSPTAWQDDLWHQFRDSRAVTETMVILRDPSLVVNQYHRMIPGFERGHLIWPIADHTGDPSSLIEAVSAPWGALIDDLNADLRR